MASLSHHEWAIPMGGQVSLEAKLQRHRDARDAVMGRRCYCPDDCRCRREDNPPCGCRQHEFPHPSRVTPTGPFHVTGLQCCGDPGDCNEPCTERNPA